MYSTTRTEEQPIAVIVIQPHSYATDISERRYILLNEAWLGEETNLVEDIARTNYALVIYVDESQTVSTIYSYMAVCELLQPLNEDLFR